MAKYDLTVFADDKQLAQAAAEQWLDGVARAEKGKPFVVALSGGRIARTFFSATAMLGSSTKELFDRVQFFWADERCVPPADPESNYRIARELLFTPLDIAENQVHRIRGEDPPQADATEAEQDLLNIASKNGDGWPVFDIIFLGMGEDGHVASLFPGESALKVAREPIYRPVRASKPPPDRITLGYAVLCAAKQVWVLASGAGKEVALRESLRDRSATPLGKVLQSREVTRILSDIRI
jgi:6-phosphogluconolactonase